MSTWVDIKFAPKDGTKVDLWVQDATGLGGRVPDAKWTRPPGWKVDAWCSYREDDWNCWLEIVPEGSSAVVTHYMLPPEPPVRT